MTPAEQRAHAVRGLQANHDAFGHGPKWTFAVDTAGDGAAAYVDCDLANDKVPAGEANVSYATHPAHRGQGLATASVLAGPAVPPRPHRRPRGAPHRRCRERTVARRGPIRPGRRARALDR